jgi:hypothetical protein
MKRSFIPYQLHRDKSGEVYRDADGCAYLKQHSHVILKGREFCNTTEAVQAIVDNNNTPGTQKFSGEVILIETLTF